MVKKLQDFCLSCVAKNISSYNRLGNFLSLKHKEVLLERMCWHNLLTATNTPSILYHLFSHSLQRVNLSYSEQVDDKILDLLGQSGCLLNSITIQNCPNVSDKGISSLGRVLRKVVEIKFKKLKLVNGKGLKAIKSQTVSVVNLKYCQNIEESGVVALVQNCPNIRKLSLCEVHKLTDRALVQIAETLNANLVELDAREVNLMTSQSTIAFAQHCKNLSIGLFESCVKLDGAGLMQMAEKCCLSFLCISFCYKVPPQACEVICSLLRAKGTFIRFQAIGLNITPLAIELLASTTSLTSLDLCGVSAVNDEMVEMVNCKNSIMEVIVSYDNQITRIAGSTLMEFDISNCKSVTDQSCASISCHCVALETLGLRNLQNVTGSDLLELFQKKKRAKLFRMITLSGSKNLSSAVVEQIVTNCSNLELITLAGVKGITDNIPEAMSLHCKKLRKASFRNCDLTDDGICKIAVHCSQLIMIALAGIHCLTDKSIVALAENCPDLRELYISGCSKITKQAVTYLQDCAVGRVLVNHSTPNIPYGFLMAKDLDTGEYCRVDDVDFNTVSGL